MSVWVGFQRGLEALLRRKSTAWIVDKSRNSSWRRWLCLNPANRFVPIRLVIRNFPDSARVDEVKQFIEQAGTVEDLRMGKSEGRGSGEL